MLQAVAVALGVNCASAWYSSADARPLSITDPVTLEDVRATDDVDLIVDLSGYAAWAELREQLRQGASSRTTPSSAACASVASTSISCPMIPIFSASAIAGTRKGLKQR